MFNPVPSAEKKNSYFKKCSKVGVIYRVDKRKRQNQNDPDILWKFRKKKMHIFSFY